MSKENLKEKYGKSKATKSLYNAAIRAECPGGNETLDLLELVSAMRGRCRDNEELAKLTTIEDRLQTIRERMLIDVKIRWGCRE